MNLRIPTVSVILLALAVGLGLAWAGGSSRAAPEHDHSAHPGGHAPAVPADEEAPHSGRSLYQLSGEWTDQDGRTVPLSLHRGHPVLVVMFYGTCQHVCPIMVQRMKEIGARLDPSEQERLRFLLVTFDPERDTPERLAAYASQRDLDHRRWTLLHGPPERVRELALVLGVRYRALEGGGFSHSMRVTLLDADGAVVEHLDGLDTPTAALAERVRELLGRG